SVEDFCNQIHRSLVKEVKYVLVWGSSARHSPQHCGLSHVLQDEDVVQIVKKKGTNITQKKQFKIGLCRLTVSPDKKTNVASARKSIEFAAKQGAALVVLPEMWNCPYSSDYFAKFAEDFKDKHGSPSFFMLSELASCHNITIVGGSVPELDNDRLYNTCCVFGSNGKLLAKHRKLHLFDVEKPAPGELSFKESDCFSAGKLQL
nr:omega-amidase, chloroplastic-like isoform X3 [Tanacetum cinerariifolium]